KEGEPRCEIDVAQAINRVGCGCGRIPFDAEQKVKTDQHPFHGGLNAAFECSAGCLSSGLVEPHQSLNVARRYRTAIRSSRECGENPSSAGFLFYGAFWTTYKNAAPALRITGAR